MPRIVIFGLGETAHLAYEYFTRDSDYEIAGFCADRAYIKTPRFLNLPVADMDEVTALFPPATHQAFAAAGSGRLNRDRANLYTKAKSKGYDCASYVSSTTRVWHNAAIGENCFIMENCTLQPFVRIGNNVTLWGNSFIAHRAILHDHCFLAPSITVAGFSEIGSHSFLGAGCTVGDYVKIAQDNFIGMGSTIYKSTEENGFYVGNPMRKRNVAARTFAGLADEI